MNAYERETMEEVHTSLIGALYTLEDAIQGKSNSRHRLAELLRYTATGLPVFGIAIPAAAENVIRRWHNTCPTAPAADNND